VIAANAVFLQGILSPTAGTNNSLWSLAYEWWYYLQFPLLILVFAKATKPLLRIVYLALLIGSALFVGRDIVTLFPTWLLGALIAALPLTTLSRWIVAPILTASITCLLLIKRFDLSKHGAALCVAVAFSLLLFCAVRHKGICGNAVYQRVSGFFSDISYTLYLVHLPLAIFICAYIDRPWHYYSLSVSNTTMFLLVNAVIIIAAYIFHGMFEGNTDRVRRLFDNKTTESGIVNFSVEKSEAQARFG
jgi:peptidoglycan/LPS O-acetylase OafA/YrhL